MKAAEIHWGVVCRDGRYIACADRSVMRTTTDRAKAEERARWVDGRVVDAEKFVEEWSRKDRN